MPVPKEHFGDISGSAAKTAGIKRHHGLEIGGYLHLPLITIVYGVYINCWHTLAWKSLVICSENHLKPG